MHVTLRAAAIIAMFIASMLAGYATVMADTIGHNSRSGSSNCNPNLPIATPQPPRPCR